MENKIGTKLLILDAILVAAILFVAFAIYASAHQPIKKETEPGKVADSKVFQKVSLEAKAAYIFDIKENKVIFEKNELAQLPLASLTKLMMALTAVELFPKETHITIKKEFLETEGNSGLLANESWRLKDLLDFSLVTSSNDGAHSIASVIGAMDLQTDDYNLGLKDFIGKMNEKARKIGLNQTYFINESGLDQGKENGGYSSAKDIAKMMQYILTNEPELLEATKYQSAMISSLDKNHLAINTNLDIDKIPGFIAGKTGFTDIAGGNLAVAFDASIGRPIIVVVLGSTEKGRFSDVQNLVLSTLDYIRQ